MAAYAVLVSLCQTVGNLIQRNPNPVLDHHGHIFHSLHGNLIFLQDVFDRFPLNVAKWEEKIHHFAHKAESIIEDYLSFSRTILDEEASVDDKRKLFHDLGKVGAMIGSIVGEVMREIGLTAGEEGNGDDSSDTKILFGNQRHEKQRLFGFEHYLTELRDCLLIHSSKLQIVPLVGMGGIGKTSLARAVFDDKRIVKHFDLRLWVTVSQSYSIKAIILAMLGVKEEEEERYEMNVIDLGVQVNQLLRHRRYLIVLDDIWDAGAWDQVRIFLRDDENRSRVLLTTRHEDVARYTKPSGSIYQLPLMNDETSWSLLSYKVFGEAHCPPELVEIGKKVANGCGGLPLAVVVIAGILTNIDLDQGSWENIAKDVNEAIRASDGHFMDILALSYHHLPHYLRPCFLYLSVFSGHKDIKASTLLRLWVAEGFIKANNTSQGVEETAYECLEEILKRNLIFATDKKYSGRTKRFRVHHLLGNLSKQKAQEEKFFLWNYDILAGRASLFGVESVQFMDLNRLSLRSSFRNNDVLSKFQSCGPCGHLRILHVADIVSSNFPSQLLGLSHLRYLFLVLSPNDDFEFSSDISKLENLETLTICFRALALLNHKSVIIPSEIWKMSKLRHITFFPAIELSKPTGKSSPLVNLLSLGGIRDFPFTEETLNLIPNVTKLDVSYVTDGDYLLNNLCHLTLLEKLTLYNNVELVSQNPMMKSLILPSSLKVLKLRGPQGGASWEDMTRITGSLPNLEFLQLLFDALTGDMWEIKDAKFQKLRVLEICDSHLRCWRSESSSSNMFPCLERLALIACPDLTELPDGIGDIPTLESVSVDDRQEAIVNWAKQIEEEQMDMGNELLEVSVLSTSFLAEEIAAMYHEWVEEDKMDKLREYESSKR